MTDETKRQLEVVGTERKYSKKLREKGEEHVKAINSHTRAGVKKRDTKLALIETMKEEGVKRYRDTESEPYLDIELTREDKLVVKKYRPPEEEKAPKTSKAEAN